MSSQLRYCYLWLVLGIHSTTSLILLGFIIFLLSLIIAYLLLLISLLGIVPMNSYPFLLCIGSGSRDIR
jgi:hypothetical protein